MNKHTLAVFLHLFGFCSLWNCHLSAGVLRPESNNPFFPYTQVKDCRFAMTSSLLATDCGFAGESHSSPSSIVSIWMGFHHLNTGLPSAILLSLICDCKPECLFSNITTTSSCHFIPWKNCFRGMWNYLHLAVFIPFWSNKAQKAVPS